MNPLYFGSSAKRLYGVYHPPRSATPRPQGILLCYPFGQEYMRAHRAFRQLATLLAKAGFPVLRFDYYGTGDSGGEGEETSLTQWTEDVRTAIQELKDTAAVDRVSLVGLRLGATLAARAVAGRTDVADLVLWDPVVSGTSYLHELLAGSAPTANGNGRPVAEGTVGVLGFPLTQRLRGELDALDLAGADVPQTHRILLVVSHEQDAFGRLRGHWQDAGAPLDYRHIPSPGNWNEVDNFGSVLMPQDLIQGIVQCLT